MTMSPTDNPPTPLPPDAARLTLPRPPVHQHFPCKLSRVPAQLPRASGLCPGRRARRVPTSRLPAAASPPSSPQASENGSYTQALAASLLLLALLQQPARPPSVAAEIILVLRHITRPPPLPSSPRSPKTRRGPPPGPPPFAPKSPPQGPPQGSAEAPESRSASPFLTAEQRRADSPAPRPPFSAPRSCHTDAALLRALGLSSPDPRAAQARGGGRAWAAVLTPPQERRRQPKDERSPGRRGKSRRVGVSGRERTRCPLRAASGPGPAPALSSAVPAPAARGPRSQPHPPAAVSLQPSALRLHPRPHLSCSCSDESGDGGGQTLATSPRSASRPPPSYSHTPPPRGREPTGKGAPRASIPGRREERRRGGEEGDTHPASHSPPGAQLPLGSRDPHPARTACARTTHTCRPTAGCAGGAGGVGAVGQVGSWSSAL